MNTQQLVIVWWGFVALVVAMLAGASDTVTFSIAGIILLTLLVFAFSKHHRSSRHKVMLAIGLPMMFLGIIGFVSGGSVDNPQMDFEANSGINLPSDSVKLVNPQIKHKFFVDTLSGSIQNNSQMTVSQVGLKVLLDAGSPSAEEWLVPLKGFTIAPGQSANFQTKIGDFHFRGNSKWKWNYQVVSVVGN